MSHLCEKRIVTCALLGEAGQVLSVGVNQCNPEGGSCLRQGARSTPEAYASGESNQCRSIHAEMDALLRLFRDAEGDAKLNAACKAVITGHEFVCSACRDMLAEHGIHEIEIRRNPE